MKKLLLFGFVFLLLVSFVAGQSDEQIEEINLKTTDFFIVQLEVANVNNIDLRNCVPYLRTTDYDIKDYTVFSPEIFDLAPDDVRVINMRLDEVPVGYYEAQVNIKCERYADDELVDVSNILNPRKAVYYQILVSPAGEGQDYVFIPVQSYQFLSNGGKESARFTIANTGSKPLDVDILPDAEYQDIISVEPRKTVIPSGERRNFQITVDVPIGFDGLETNLTIKIGDYTEYFQIIGQKESLGVFGGAVAQNLLQGTVSAGNLSIPTWLLVLVILGGTAYLFKDNITKQFKKNRGKKRR